MDVVEALEQRGGLSTRAALIAATTRADVDRALSTGAVVRAGHGRYTLAQVEAAQATAHGMNGILCLTNAALFHGWEVKSTPDLPHVVVPRKRNVPQRLRPLAQVHRADLGPDDIASGIATSRELTLMQCLRSLPDDEALAIADSALRAGEHATMRRVLATARGAGRTKILRIARAARAEAANPFESVVRSIALTVPGLQLEPQVVIDGPHVWARPDLVDRDRMLVVECESFEWHATRAGFRKDLRRYTLLTADGWIVLRFSWEDAMLRPWFIREVLLRVAGVVDTRTQVVWPWPQAA